MGRTIGLISLKGGVGKTTLSAAIAATLANRYGKKVLLVDGNYSAPNLGLHMDIISPEGSVQDVLAGARLSSAIHERYGVDVVPGDFLYGRRINPLKLKSRLSFVKKNYDFIIVDSSPSLNDEVLSTMMASDDLFVVTTPDYPTLSCSMKATKIARERNSPISGMIINRVEKPLYELTLEEVQESTGIPVVAKIREDKSVKRALFERVPATLHKKRSRFSNEVNRFCSALVGEKERKGLISSIFRNFRKERVNREVLRESYYKSMFK